MRATVGKADTDSLKFLHTLFNTHLDHIQAKFEPNRFVQNVQNFELFDKKPSVLKPVLTKRGSHFFSVSETIVLMVTINCRTTFTVPNIMIVQPFITR